MTSKLFTHDSSAADRRVHPRYRVHVALEIDAGVRTGRLGISQDASAAGMLFNTRTRLALGDEVTVTLHLSSPLTQDTRVTGKIIRVQSGVSQLPWRCLAALRFDRAMPELDAKLKARAAR